jgi:hypothetical protein
MPFTARRLKLFWGAVDLEYVDESGYAPSQTFSGGLTSEAPGIGVRRASLRYSRAGMGPGEDVLVTHMDFLNLTGGEPDDSWTAGDFALLEAAISDWDTAIKAHRLASVVFDQIRWYRIGKGSPVPNPPVRITEVNTAGTSTSPLPPQTCMTVTLRPAARKQWGRMYLNFGNANGLTSIGALATGYVDLVANATASCFQVAQEGGFEPVVYSPTRGKAYTIEKLQVDDIPDVIRSRRFDLPTYKKIIP